MGNLLGKYNLVLGLEIHIQAKTKNKMFCGCSADIWKAEPNSHTCPTCLGLPGALPVANFEAIEKTHLLGLALSCSLKNFSRFDRKHYFYHDLPKGYQISQYKEPLCEGGYLDLDSGERILLERIHLEEDTAKSFHEDGKTLIDFNKSGMPLIELVTKPVFSSAEDAVEFSQKIQHLARVLSVSEADMEKGQLRIEPNISLRTRGMMNKGEIPKYKVEIKNINSFKFMQKAVESEILRQRDILDSGQTPAQENRGYVERGNTTVAQRSKEEAHDYRYFPEPDIPPMVFAQGYFEALKSCLSVLPHIKIDGYVKDCGIFRKTAQDLVNTGMSQKFDECVASGVFEKNSYQKLANILLTDLKSRELTPEKLFSERFEKKNFEMDKEGISNTVSRLLADNPKIVQDYKSGKENAIQVVVGMVMRELGGKASPVLVKDIALELLKR